MNEKEVPIQKLPPGPINENLLFQKYSHEKWLGADPLVHRQHITALHVTDLIHYEQRTLREHLKRKLNGRRSKEEVAQNLPKAKE